MAEFAQTFDETTPPGSALANTLDTVIQNDKEAVNERYQLEHYALDASGEGQSDSDSANAQGRHIPGKVSAVYIGTTAQIAALTGMVTGALAYDTTLGYLKIYNGADWTTISVGATMINSVQRNTTALTVGASSTETVTITSVDTTKAFLLLSVANSGSAQGVYGYLTNATTVTIKNINGAFGASVYWQVIEYK